MRQLDRYIALTVGNMMVAAVLGLVGVLTIFTFIEQIEDVQGDYTMFKVVMFCLFSVPRIIYELIPFGALVGCLAGLGALASSSELVVMRAAGVSTWRITWSAIIPVLFLAALGVLVGEFVLPDLERTAHRHRRRQNACTDCLPGTRDPESPHPCSDYQWPPCDSDARYVPGRATRTLPPVHRAQSFRFFFWQRT